MWRNHLKYLAGHPRWVLGAGGVVAFIGTAWFFSALASPIVTRHLTSHGGVRAAAGALASTLVPDAPVPLQTFEKLPPQQALEINNKVPFSSLPNAPAKPFNFAFASPEDRASALTCLTMAVYYEAGNQGPDGEAAVAQVVLNRVRHPLFPKSVCGVVFQGSSLPTGCQFTFTCDGSLGRRPSQAGWKQAARVAERALDGYVEANVGEATHYHTVWVVPYWQSSVVKLAQIGAHVFYRWPGALGSPGAFEARYAGTETPPPSIDGFDTGQAQVEVASIAPQAPPPPVVAAPAPVALSAPPVQVALLTPAVMPAAAGEIVNPSVDGSKSYDGRAGTGHHLPMPAHW